MALTGMPPDRLREFTQQILQLQTAILQDIQNAIQQWSQMLPTQITGNIISVPAKVDIYNQSKYSINDSEWTEVNLHGDVVIITADDDTYYSKVTGMTGFILRSGAYLLIARSEELDRLYFKAVAGSTDLYVQELVIKQK